MPIYEYHCTACAHEFEEIQKISEAPITQCPSCHKHKAEKLVSAAGFQLKGSGWYVTDFRDKGKPQKAEESKQADTKPKQTETKTTPNKAETKQKSET